jgi:4-hydroxybenzoate polyprenyltransferase
MNTSIKENLSITSPFIKRFNAWAKERFPIANIISGSLSYITMVSIGRFIGGKEVTDFGIFDILGAIAFISHLLLLRIFDEHKDFEVDLINHPKRALSKGLITLRHLTLLAIPLPVLGLMWSFSNTSTSMAVVLIWSVLFIYSLLMAKEFFIGPWLTKRLVTYSISHMLVSPIMILWIIVGGSGSLISTNLLYFVLAVSFTSGISYELTRKIRGTDEDPALDSYNKSFGVNGSLVIMTIFNIVSLLLGLLIINEITSNNTISIIILTLGYTSTFYPTINFIKKPIEKSRKINEGGLGLFFLGLYVSILVSLFI